MVNTVISTFAGGGGSSLGYKMAGFKELLAIDWDSNACETLKANFNFPVWQRDIKTVTGKEILNFCKIKKGELDILDGSPPCQGFSTAGKREVGDMRNNLFYDFIRLIKDLQPKIFVAENVSGMMKGKMKGLFNEILKTFKELNYNVKCKLMNAMYYGVPQSRQRIIFIGVRNDLKIEPVYPTPSNKIITVGEAFKGMKKQKVPALSPCFKDVIPFMRQGQSVNDINKNNKHMQTIRIYKNKPCPTITKIIGSIGFGSLIHFKENRVLSIEEIKKVCTFPDDYMFIGSYQEQKARMGNSVPPLMVKAITKTLKDEILDKYYKEVSNG